VAAGRGDVPVCCVWWIGEGIRAKLGFGVVTGGGRQRTRNASLHGQKLLAMPVCSVGNDCDPPQNKAREQAVS